MATIYRAADADPALLAGWRVAVLGYGNQGRSQALNLRDSGCQVVIGNRDDEYVDRARADGLVCLPFASAIRQSDAILLLLPDEVTTSIFDTELLPHFRRDQLLCFASGYSIGFGLIAPPDGVDTVLIAPRMIGAGVRQCFLDQTGFFSFVAVHHDATGEAKRRLLSLALGLGTLWKGAVEITFRMEAELDLFNEQAFGPAFGRVLLGSINTLLEAGYPAEAVLLEIYLSGELGYITQTMASTGLFAQLEDHSPASQYGAISRGMHFLGVNLARPMKRILAHIRNGGFAREWQLEQKLGKPRYRFLKMMALAQPLHRMEKAVRQSLGLTNNKRTFETVDDRT